MPADSVLLADDDLNSLEVERLYLEREGFRVFSVRTGFEALNSIRTVDPNLVVLAVNVPGLDGFEVCRRLRGENNQVPVLAIFPNNEPILAMDVLSLEADDFLAKPFNPRELVARVKNLLHWGRKPARRKSNEISFRNLNLDLLKREFSINGKLVPLPSIEFEILAFLARESGKYVSRDDLLQEAWGYDFPGQTLTVNLHVARLQNRLSASGVKIQSDPEEGFKLEG